MSYILDAVKQAEHERGDSRLLREQDAHNQVGNLSRGGKPWLAIAIFLNAVVLLLWLVLKITSDSTFFSVSNNQADNQEKVKETVVLPVGAKPSFLAASESKQKIVITQNSTTKKTTPIKTVASHEKPKPVAIEPKQKITAPIEEIEVEKGNAIKSEASQIVIAKVEPLPRSQVDSSEVSKVESVGEAVKVNKVDEKIIIPENIEVPSLGELPYSLQKQIPKLKISVHVFNPRKEARKVKINSRLYFQGDTIENDLIVEEITSHGVVFNYSGTLFKLNLH